MAKIFISFVGLGRKQNVDEGKPGYDLVCYQFNGKKTSETYFVQRTILEEEGVDSFDKIVLFMTKDSEKNYLHLSKEFKEIQVDENKIEKDNRFTTNMDTADLWKWFDKLFKYINNGDEVIFDFTHGFRSIPIIFSTAISFIQKVKRFTLLHAYYGFIHENQNEQNKAKEGAIIDLVDFYQINEWADGVNQLVETADTSKLVRLAKKGNQTSFSDLTNEELIKALNELSKIVKNIDINRVAESATKAIGEIKKAITRAEAKGSHPTKQLLELIQDKFADLAVSLPEKKYTLDYFKVQLELIRILNEHGLYMQSFTVMRELIASIGLIKLPEKEKFYREYGNFFIHLIEEREQKFQSSIREIKSVYLEEVNNFYDELNEKGLLTDLFEKSKIPYKDFGKLSYEIRTQRNAFNHAWLFSNSHQLKNNLKEIGKKAKNCYLALKNFIEALENEGILKK